MKRKKSSKESSSEKSFIKVNSDKTSSHKGATGQALPPDKQFVAQSERQPPTNAKKEPGIRFLGKKLASIKSDYDGYYDSPLDSEALERLNRGSEQSAAQKSGEYESNVFSQQSGESGFGDLQNMCRDLSTELNVKLAETQRLLKQMGGPTAETLDLSENTDFLSETFDPDGEGVHVVQRGAILNGRVIDDSVTRYFGERGGIGSSNYQSGSGVVSEHNGVEEYEMERDTPLDDTKYLLETARREGRVFSTEENSLSQNLGNSPNSYTYDLEESSSLQEEATEASIQSPSYENRRKRRKKRDSDQSTPIDSMGTSAQEYSRNSFELLGEESSSNNLSIADFTKPEMAKYSHRDYMDNEPVHINIEVEEYNPKIQDSTIAIPFHDLESSNATTIHYTKSKQSVDFSRLDSLHFKRKLEFSEIEDTIYEERTSDGRAHSGRFRKKKKPKKVDQRRPEGFYINRYRRRSKEILEKAEVVPKRFEKKSAKPGKQEFDNIRIIDLVHEKPKKPPKSERRRHEGKKRSRRIRGRSKEIVKTEEFLDDKFKELKKRHKAEKRENRKTSRKRKRERELSTRRKAERLLQDSRAFESPQEYNQRDVDLFEKEMAKFYKKGKNRGIGHQDGYKLSYQDSYNTSDSPGPSHEPDESQDLHQKPYLLEQSSSANLKPPQQFQGERDDELNFREEFDSQTDPLFKSSLLSKLESIREGELIKKTEDRHKSDILHKIEASGKLIGPPPAQPPFMAYQTPANGESGMSGVSIVDLCPEELMVEDQARNSSGRRGRDPNSNHAEQKTKKKVKSRGKAERGQNREKLKNESPGPAPSSGNTSRNTSSRSGRPPRSMRRTPGLEPRNSSSSKNKEIQKTQPKRFLDNREYFDQRTTEESKKYATPTPLRKPGKFAENLENLDLAKKNSFSARNHNKEVIPLFINNYIDMTNSEKDMLDNFNQMMDLENLSHSPQKIGSERSQEADESEDELKEESSGVFITPFKFKEESEEKMVNEPFLEQGPVKTIESTEIKLEECKGELGELQNLENAKIQVKKMKKGKHSESSSLRPQAVPEGYFNSRSHTESSSMRLKLPQDQYKSEAFELPKAVDFDTFCKRDSQKTIVSSLSNEDRLKKYFLNTDDRLEDEEFERQKRLLQKKYRDSKKSLGRKNPPKRPAKTEGSSGMLDPRSSTPKNQKKKSNRANLTGKEMSRKSLDPRAGNVTTGLFELRQVSSARDYSPIVPKKAQNEKIINLKDSSAKGSSGRIQSQYSSNGSKEEQIGVICTVKELDDSFCKREIKMEIRDIIFVKKPKKSQKEVYGQSKLSEEHSQRSYKRPPSPGTPSEEYRMLSQRNRERAILSAINHQQRSADPSEYSSPMVYPDFNPKKLSDHLPSENFSGSGTHLGGSLIDRKMQEESSEADSGYLEQPPDRFEETGMEYSYSLTGTDFNPFSKKTENQPQSDKPWGPGMERSGSSVFGAGSYSGSGIVEARERDEMESHQGYQGHHQHRQDQQYQQQENPNEASFGVFDWNQGVGENRGREEQREDDQRFEGEAPEFGGVDNRAERFSETISGSSFILSQSGGNPPRKKHAHYEEVQEYTDEIQDDDFMSQNEQEDREDREPLIFGKKVKMDVFVEEGDGANDREHWVPMDQSEGDYQYPQYPKERVEGDSGLGDTFQHNELLEKIELAVRLSRDEFKR